MLQERLDHMADELSEQRELLKEKDDATASLKYALQERTPSFRISSVNWTNNAPDWPDWMKIRQTERERSASQTNFLQRSKDEIGQLLESERMKNQRLEHALNEKIKEFEAMNKQRRVEDEMLLKQHMIRKSKSKTWKPYFRAQQKMTVSIRNGRKKREGRKEWLKSIQELQQQLNSNSKPNSIFDKPLSNRSSCRSNLNFE